LHPNSNSNIFMKMHSSGVARALGGGFLEPLAKPQKRGPVLHVPTLILGNAVSWLAQHSLRVSIYRPSLCGTIVSWLLALQGQNLGNHDESSEETG
jgi:hypothetical protein